jgi:hypothetical protein
LTFAIFPWYALITKTDPPFETAGVAELADALASGASDRKVIGVQLPSPALITYIEIEKSSLWLIAYSAK